MNGVKVRRCLPVAAAVALLALAFCAETLPVQAETAQERPSVELTDADAPCVACHTDQAQSAEAAAEASDAAKGENGGCLMAVHPVASCTACHDATDTKFTKVHGKVTPDSKLPKKLKKTKVGSEACLGCHEEDYVPEAVADCMLVDTAGIEVNPHAVPANDSHDKKVTCTGCHTIHGEADVVDSARKLCFECHHVQKFECNTCHEA